MYQSKARHIFSKPLTIDFPQEYVPNYKASEILYSFQLLPEQLGAESVYKITVSNKIDIDWISTVQAKLWKSGIKV